MCRFIHSNAILCWKLWKCIQDCDLTQTWRVLCAGVLLSVVAVCSQWLVYMKVSDYWGGTLCVSWKKCSNCCIMIRLSLNVVEFIECLLEWLNLESFSPAPASRCSTAKPFTLLQFVCSDTNSLFLWKHSVWTEVWTFPGGDLVALWLSVHLILPLRWWEVMPLLDSMLLFLSFYSILSTLKRLFIPFIHCNYSHNVFVACFVQVVPMFVCFF